MVQKVHFKPIKHVPKTYFRTWFYQRYFCMRHLVLGLYFAVRISAASESLPDLTLVVRREWTRRLAPPAREWTERIGMLRFEEERIKVVSSARAVPLLDDEFAVTNADEPQWSYLSQLAQAAFLFNNSCVDAALLVSHMWPSQAERMQAWIRYSLPAVLQSNTSLRHQGCRRAASDAKIRSKRVSAFPIFSVMPPAPLIFDVENLVSSVECLRDIESPMCIYRQSVLC